MNINAICPKCDGYCLDKDLNYKKCTTCGFMIHKFVDSKKCRSCLETKLVDQFNKRKNNKDGLYSYCKDCKAKIDKEYRENEENRDNILLKKKIWHRKNKKSSTHNREKYLLITFNLSLETYNEMLEEQDFKCLICSKEHTEELKLSVDHCHKTGKIRKLLCRSCNLGIGVFKENVEFLNNAIEYIKKESKND